MQTVSSVYLSPIFRHANISSPCIIWSFQPGIAFINVFHGIFLFEFIDKKVLSLQMRE